MIINLNQREIETALKFYIADQGINLAGKSVEVNFTAGRKETGISAELDIGSIGEVPMTVVLPRDFGVAVAHSVVEQAEATEPEQDDNTPEEYTEPVSAKSSVSLFG